ncbi:ribosome-associated translation inhibitor RaiA [bacterium]|nr:ribosome-associated translation inhibitor RaiA [bacterium]
MRINIKPVNVGLDQALIDWIYEKLGEIEKYLSDFESGEIPGGKETIELNVEIGKTTRHHRKGDVFRAEAQLYLPKELIRVEATDNDLRAAIDQIKEQLYRKIKKYKRKRIIRARKWARVVKEVGRIHRVLLKENNKVKKLLRAFKKKK